MFPHSPLNSLHEAPFSGKPVYGTISLSHRPDITTQSNSFKFASIDTLLVDLSNVELHASVILGSDQTVCSGAGKEKEGDE